MTEDRKLFLHHWNNDPSHLMTHLSTGLRFVCIRLRAGPAVRPNWDVLRVMEWADLDVVQAEADECGMTLDKYLDYLEDTALEMAGKADRKNPRKPLKF